MPRQCSGLAGTQHEPSAVDRITVPPNKGMKLTNLSAAPARTRIGAPPHAPACPRRAGAPVRSLSLVFAAFLWNHAMRRASRALTIIGMVATATACTSGPPFRAYLDELATAAGGGAQNCGVVSYGAAQTPAIECVTEALRLRRPVWVAFQVLGTDSQIYIGLAADATGQAWRITWDSDTSGGASLIASRHIKREGCPMPDVALRAEGQGGPIDCKR